MSPKRQKPPSARESDWSVVIAIDRGLEGAARPCFPSCSIIRAKDPIIVERSRPDPAAPSRGRGRGGAHATTRLSLASSVQARAHRSGVGPVVGVHQPHRLGDCPGHDAEARCSLPPFIERLEDPPRGGTPPARFPEARSESARPRTYEPVCTSTSSPPGPWCISGSRRRRTAEPLSRAVRRRRGSGPEADDWSSLRAFWIGCRRRAIWPHDNARNPSGR